MEVDEHEGDLTSGQMKKRKAQEALKASVVGGGVKGKKGDEEEVEEPASKVQKKDEDDEEEEEEVLDLTESPDASPPSPPPAPKGTKEHAKGGGLRVILPDNADKKKDPVGPQTPGSARGSCSSLDLSNEELNLLNEDECAVCGDKGELPPSLFKGEDGASMDSQSAEKQRHRRLRTMIHREVLSVKAMEEEEEEEEGGAGGGSKEAETTAALRGIDYLYRLALNKRNFANFGSDILAVLYDLASCTEGAIRRAALQRTEILAKHWKSRFKTLADIARDVRKHRDQEDDEEEEEEEPEPSKDDVNTAIRGMYVLMRMGLWTPLAAETREFVKAGHFRVQDFLDFDPKKKLNPLPKKRPQFSLANAIDTAFHADRVGVKLGASVLDVISLLSRLRPYQKCVDIMWEDWEDQADMVINLIHVCSNNGELRLNPALFPAEEAFFRDPDTLKWPLEEEDVHLVGEICHCLKVLGAADDDPIVKRGKQFILERQEEDGSWPVRDKTTEPWDKFLATVSGVVGLVPLSARAFGPGDTALADTLRKVNTAVAVPQSIAKAVEEAAKPKVAPPSVIMCGATRPIPVRRFRTVQHRYERSSDAHIERLKGDAFIIGDVPLEIITDPTLKGRSQQRFQELLSYKRRKMALPTKGSGSKQGPNWFRQQDKNSLAAAVRAAAEALDRTKFGKSLKDFQNGKEPDLRPVCGTSRTDLYSLYQAVASRGGRAMVPTIDDWAAIARKPQVNAAQGLNDRGRRARELYEKYLGDFELYCAEEHHSHLQREEIGRIVDARMQERADKQRRARQALLSPTKKGQGEGGEGQEDQGSGGEDGVGGGASSGGSGMYDDVNEAPPPFP